MTQIEGYDPAVSLTTYAALNPPGAKPHNVCKMKQVDMLRMGLVRFVCETCHHQIDVWKEMADGREFTCGGETVRAYPPL